MDQNNNKNKKRPVFLRILLWIFCGIIIISILSFLAFLVSPWPAAMIIRKEFNEKGNIINDSLRKRVPADIHSILNEQYSAGDKDALLDIYYSDYLEDSKSLLPVIVWIHGGGWVFGSKDQVANYCKILAGRKYIVAAVNYSLAPGENYPVQLRQVNEALKYLKANAEKFHIDITKIILAGDSGGAQITAEVANIICEPSFAGEIGIVPAIQKPDLIGVILFCGAFNMDVGDPGGLYGEFIKTVLWSYSGTKDYATDPKFKSASVINYVTENFPPTFISAGNKDPLLSQSISFADKLSEKGVYTDKLFFPENYTPELQHEYQFDLDNEGGKFALLRIQKFISERVGESSR